MIERPTAGKQQRARQTEMGLRRSIHRWLWGVTILLALTDVVFTLFLGSLGGVFGAAVPTAFLPAGFPPVAVGLYKLALIGLVSALVGLVHWLFVRGSYSHVAPVFLLFLWLSSALASLGVALVIY